jgi:hypothetical protein
LAHQHIPFLQTKFVDIIHKGQWILLPASLVVNDPNLHLSTLGIVPPQDHSPHTISDYTFFWVKKYMIAIAPGECMHFGRDLWRIIKHVKHANPKLGQIFLSKIDVANGFYQISVRAVDVPKLGVLFPSREGDEHPVGSPIALPMGWKELPNIFTVTIEKVVDLANQQVTRGAVHPPHHLKIASEQPAIELEVPICIPTIEPICPSL